MLKSFENIKSSSNNIFHEFENSFDLSILFNILPVSVTKTYGLITSLRYNGKVRGKNGGQFPNCLMLNVNLEKEMVVKVFKEKIQTTGCSSKKQSNEIIYNLKKNIMYSKYIIKEIVKDTNKIALNWILNSSNEQISDLNTSQINPILLRYLIRYSEENHQKEDFKSAMINIYSFKIDSILDFKVNFTKFVYLNYNFKLEKEIDRWKIADLLKKNSDFLIIYDNTISKNVTVNIPFEITEEFKNEIQRKKDKMYHTILIHKTGSVTQTSPHPELAKDAYNKFKELIEKFGNKIYV